MRRALRIGWLAASVAVSACDGFGGALVGDIPRDGRPPPTPNLVACPEAPSCADPVPRPALIAPSSEAFDLAGCAQGAPPLPVCPEPREPPVAADDDDAGVASFDDPDAGSELDEPCEPLQAWQAFAERAAEATCDELGARLEPDDTGALELRDARMDLANLVLRAERPVTVRLVEPSLRQTSIELRGPVRLEISRPRSLDELRIRGQASAAGAPSLYVAERSARGLVAGSPELPFEGTVDLTFVAASDSQLVADRVTVRSGTFYDGRIEAPQLDVLESELNQVTLRVGDGRIAASVVTLVEVTECGSFGLFASASTGSLFPACSDAPLRVYQSNVTDGLLDGVVDTDIADLCNVRLGQRSPTSLWLWSGTLLGSSLCEHTASVVVGGRAARNACEGPARQAGAICAAEEDQKLDDNACEQLRTAPQCEALPPHERPEQDRQDHEGRLRNRD